VTSSLCREEVTGVAKFEMYQDRSDEWRWRFRADNYKIIADSAEGYVNKSDCRHGIDLLKKQAPDAEVEEE
jgi:uncharacterized protein YegP (UPF0339 family)